uniref:Integrase catalytic domain-containing protein n=1 Tax=Anopheles quadriannulatus TaxID=34691 RepID=A0A182XPU1_ANOQN
MGVLFTCLTTRAVHIEIATNMSTDAFVMCLKNMQHRREKISCMYSDNGTNFVGADNELRRFRERRASNGIDWAFNPPGSPHFGCSGEAKPNISGTSKTYRADWEKAQAITREYWKRWVNEYPPKLARREK